MVLSPSHLSSPPLHYASCFKAGLDLSLVSALLHYHTNREIHELKRKSLNLVGEQTVHTSGWLLYSPAHTFSSMHMGGVLHSGGPWSECSDKGEKLDIILITALLNISPDLPLLSRITWGEKSFCKTVMLK